VSLEDVPAECLAVVSTTTLHRILLRMRVALAAECLGAAQRCLDMATSYAKVRQQFGRPIGQFQAIKHRLADLLVEIEMARSCVYAAACHLASRSWAEAELSAPAALAAATSALSRAARDNVQVHGGIAFTWEHDAHLFVRRGAASSSLLGPASDLHRTVYDVAG
jgi:alkylation response protein AidB-like acyl-CoA dehydrogenase